MVSIYVGNLLFKTTQDEIRSLFEQHGEVISVKLITDRDENAANQAVEHFNGMEFGGRMLKVNISRDKR